MSGSKEIKFVVNKKTGQQEIVFPSSSDEETPETKGGPAKGGPVDAPDVPVDAPEVPPHRSRHKQNVKEGKEETNREIQPYRDAFLEKEKRERASLKKRFKNKEEREKMKKLYSREAYLRMKASIAKDAPSEVDQYWAYTSDYDSDKSYTGYFDGVDDVLSKSEPAKKRRTRKHKW
jgi:hypothetical protein